MKSDAPWWVIPTLTFAGVVLAQSVVVLLYFARQRSEDRRRWHAKRLEVYSDFTKQYLKLRRQLKPTAALVGDGGYAELIRSQDYADERGLWLDHYFQIEMVGSDPVRKAARQLTDKMSSHERFDSEDPDDLIASMQSLNRAKREFDQQVRFELGIDRPARFTASADDRLGLIWEAFRSVAVSISLPFASIELRPRTKADQSAEGDRDNSDS